MIEVTYIPHDKALDFIGPTVGDPDLSGWYWTSTREPELDPQGPFASQDEAERHGNENEIDEE